MSYIIAIDGGGTKTHLSIFDIKGQCIYQKIGQGSNHQSAGIDHFKTVISDMVGQAISQSGIKRQAIALCYLGLSGADLPSDYALLNDACKEIFDDIPFHVDNDAWLILRSGLSKPYGAVCISGTGTNAAAMSKTGKRAILRSLGFTLGIYGGGLDIAREALHYAFRADELTYKDTMLRTEIPKLLGVKDMSEVVPYFYPTQTIDRHTFGQITALVHRCANQNDQVSKDILRRIGHILADQTAGVIRQVDMTEEDITVVIGGRVFDGESPILIRALKRQIKKQVPKAHIIKPVFPPVVGAYLLALDRLKIPQTQSLMQTLKESWSSHA